MKYHHLTPEEKRALAERVAKAVNTFMKPMIAEYEAAGQCPRCFSKAVAIGLASDFGFHLGMGANDQSDIDDIVAIVKDSSILHFKHVDDEPDVAPGVH